MGGSRFATADPETLPDGRRSPGRVVGVAPASIGGACCPASAVGLRDKFASHSRVAIAQRGPIGSRMAGRAMVGGSTVRWLTRGAWLGLRRLRRLRGRGRPVPGRAQIKRRLGLQGRLEPIPIGGTLVGRDQKTQETRLISNRSGSPVRILTSDQPVNSRTARFL
jgi:hypothetical protein